MPSASDIKKEISILDTGVEVPHPGLAKKISMKENLHWGFP
jgi:hypothetical protein